MFSKPSLVLRAPRCRGSPINPWPAARWATAAATATTATAAASIAEAGCRRLAPLPSRLIMATGMVDETHCRDGGGSVACWSGREMTSGVGGRVRLWRVLCLLGAGGEVQAEGCGRAGAGATKSVINGRRWPRRRAPAPLSATTPPGGGRETWCGRSAAAEPSPLHAPPRRQCLASRGAARRPSGRCVARAPLPAASSCAACACRRVDPRGR